MLDGTETLLTYDMKITFTNKPENLKFYSNEDRTQEILVENNEYLTVNGFMSLDDVKEARTQKIYWQWQLETGYTEDEIEENDEKDTEFMGKTMSMHIDVNGKQVMSNPYEVAVASATVNGKVTLYEKVQDAIDAVGQNQGAIVTLLKDEIEESVEIKENQNIVMDTNGKMLFSNESTINCNGDLRITGNGTIKSTSGISGVYCVVNYGTGIVNVENGNIIGYSGMKNNAGGTLIILEGKISASGHGVRNVIGDLKMYGGYVKAAWGDAIWTSTGNAWITGGTIIGCTSGIVKYGGAEGNIIIGTNNKTVSTTSPVIMATNGTGISGQTAKSIEFYDGIVKVKLEKNLIVRVDKMPQGYHLIEGENEIIDGSEYKVTYLVKD